MKKIVSLLLAMSLVLLSVSAFAAVPEAGSLNAKQKTIRGDNAFLPESLPDIYITPFYKGSIIEGNKNYPAHFLHFKPLDDYTLYDFDYDSVTVANYDSLYMFIYSVYDSMSFEVFLEKAEKDNIVADGSDGKLAIYVEPDSHRARAMINVKDYFGKSAKAVIIFTDSARDTKRDDLVKIISDEVARLNETMKFEELDAYWSKDAYASVELRASRSPISVVIDTTGLTVTNLEHDNIQSIERVGTTSEETEFELGTYAYVNSQEEAKEVTLKNGTACKIYTTDYTGYAAFLLEEKGEHDSVYLTIEIGCNPADFMQKLEDAYARVTISLE